MESSLKIFLFFVVAVLGIFQASVLAQVLTPTPPECCTRTQADVNPANWDKCTKEGTFKSVSFCYQSNRGTNVSRYDYFQCSRSGSSGKTFILSKRNCPGPLVLYQNGNYTDVFNRFDESSKTCNLVPPTTTTTATTMASNATTNATTVPPKIWLRPRF